MSDDLVFSSKIDIGILVLLLVTVAAAVCGLTVLWASAAAPDPAIALVLSLPLAALAVLPLWILMSLRYFLSAERLRVRCGPFQRQIAIAEIRNVAPSRNFGFGPALSTDALRIDAANGESLTISPEPRKEFLRQLEHRRGRRG